MAVTFDNDISDWRYASDTTDCLHILTYDNSAYTHNYSLRQTDFDYFRDDAAVGDYIVFGWVWEKWHNLKLNITTPLVADAINIVWEYLDYNGIWQTLTVTDNSNMFQNSGSQVVEFEPPIDWKYVRINTPGTEYTRSYGSHIRARIVSVTNISEGGANGTIRPDGKDFTVQITGTETLPSIYDYVKNTLGLDYIVRTGETYQFYCNFRIGDTDATATTFTMLGESLEMGETNYTLGSNYGWYAGKFSLFSPNTTDVWNMGNSTGNGCNLRLNVSSTGKSPYNYLFGIFNWYNSHCYKEFGGYGEGGMRGGVKTFENCIFSPWQSFYLPGGSTGSFKNCIIDVNTTWWYIYSRLWDFDNIQVIAGSGIFAQGATLSNTDFGSKILYCYSQYNYLIDCTIDDLSSAFNVAVRTSCGGIVQYHYNADVIDEDGTSITANIEIKNSEGTVVYDSDSSTDVLLTTYQDVTTSTTTNNVVTNFNPFTITISKAGYVTYEEKITITKRIDKKVALKTSPAFTLSTDGNLSKYLDPDNPKNLGLVLPL